ncbi:MULTISPECIES: exopolyphosphatase [Gordonibacter]|uniref:Exopolyphosphatase n=1 Tax=Gordonibacter faecis TaxID=3047475 RepID=A0ABT7DLW1_9ACTN|nr:exopolyphosphatase [Gordonibacter sp. KGMB12511]MDJ1650511.1 exopolyphosphatase [Gordonibacter sp. KGMB12511]
MPNYGVIDLGSNTIRLVVYEVKDDRRACYTGKDFKSLINDKVMAGLSAFVTPDGTFTEVGVQRAASVLKGHAKRARYFNCVRVDVFATAVVRNASNCTDVVAAIEEASGLPLTLLSARDEAHLGFVGASLDRTLKDGTLVDIGGGSTELTRALNGHEFQNISLPLGSLSAYAAHVSAILPTPDEMDAIATAACDLLTALPNPEAYRAPVLYGIGGSVRAAAKMRAQAEGMLTRPKSMTAAEIRAILEWCRTDPNPFAHCALKASAERIHTLVPGCLILATLMEHLGAERLDICKYGVREGYLVERMLG